MEDEQRRGKFLPAGQGSPAIGTPGSLTTLGGSSSGASGAQTSSASGLAVTQEYAEVVITDSTPELRTTQAYAEVVRTDTTPELRSSQIYAEVVVERDYAGWDTFILDDPTGSGDNDVVSF